MSFAQLAKGFLAIGVNLLGGGLTSNVDVALEWNKVALDINIMDHNGPAGTTIPSRRRQLERELYLIEGIEQSVETPAEGAGALTNGPPGSARALAMIHIAMFEAYCCVVGKYMSYYDDDDNPVDCSGYTAADTSVEVAIAQAARNIMNGFDGEEPGFPEKPGLYGHNATIIKFVDDALQTTKERAETREDVQNIENGIQVGNAIAMRVLEDRSTDGFSVEDPFLADEVYTPRNTPGDHDVDPVNPGQGFLGVGASKMTPFGMTTDELVGFRAPAPPGLTEHMDGTFTLDEFDPTYVAALRQVKEYGKFRGGTEQDEVPTDDNTYEIANFWSANGSPRTGTPTNVYNDIARKIAIEQGNDWEDNMVLFTMINLSIANSAISTWDSKFHWRMWRPVLAIQNYPAVAPIIDEEDGGEGGDDEPVRQRALVDEDPIRDPNWVALGASRSNPYEGERNFAPPFPGHTSGHATFGCTVFQTLANFYGTYDIPFEYTSVEWNGETKDQFNRVRPCLKRSFTTLKQAMAENAASRVFNGVHYDFEGGEGCSCGMNIANHVWMNMLPNALDAERTMMAATDVTNQINEYLTDPQTSGYPAQVCDAGTPPYPFVAA